MILIVVGLTVVPVFGGDCFELAANRYALNPDLLRSIAYVESGGNPYAIHYNSNGSYDMGLMQINSSWLPKLGEFGISDQMLLQNSCLNIMVGAWILAHNVKENGYTWQAVGRYNASSHHKMLAYAHRVYKTFHQLQARKN